MYCVSLMRNWVKGRRLGSALVPPDRWEKRKSVDTTGDTGERVRSILCVRVVVEYYTVIICDQYLIISGNREKKKRKSFNRDSNSTDTSRIAIDHLSSWRRRASRDIGSFVYDRVDRPGAARRTTPLRRL